NAHGAHVACHLAARFLEAEVQAALAAATRCVDKLCRQRCLAGTGRPRDQDTTAAIVTSSTQHGVEARYACRDAFIQGSVLELKRRDRQHRNAMLINQEWVVIGAVYGAAILHHAQTPREDRV